MSNLHQRIRASFCTRETKDLMMAVADVVEALENRVTHLERLAQYGKERIQPPIVKPGDVDDSGTL